MYLQIFKKIFIFAIILGAVFVVAAAASSYASEENCGYHNNSSEDCEYIECHCDSDCGSSAFIGDPFCQGGDVYRNYRTSACLYPGTEDAECSVSTSPKLWYECESWQTCQSGACVTQYDAITVQTKPATNISGTQATLNGYLYNNNTNCNADAWFEYGPTSSYGYQTNRQTKSYTTAFSQNMNLSGNYTNYHFRAVAEDCRSNTVYGQDLAFYVDAGQGILSINKTAKNLTTGSSWSNVIYASPADTLMFMIELRSPSNQSVSNVFVRDYFPQNLIYKDQLVVSGAGYSGQINSGLSIQGAIPAGQTVTITYQAQVAEAPNFNYGTTTLNNNVSATSSNSGYVPSARASIVVTKSAVYGATTIPTGLTNNVWLDSFFIPIAVVLLGLWMWRSGMFFGIEKWLTNKKKIYATYSSGKKLTKRITAIQKSEK